MSESDRIEEKPLGQEEDSQKEKETVILPENIVKEVFDNTLKKAQEISDKYAEPKIEE